MALGGFLQQVGLNVGNDMIVGQDMAAKQADIDYKQNLVAQQKQQMQSAKDMGNFLKQAGLQDAQTVNDPAKAAQMYEKASDLAAQNGDFDGAAKMSALAKGKLSEAKDAAAAVTQAQSVKKEALATKASDFNSNPTKQGQDDLVKAALDAGVNPNTIPIPGTPAFAAWTKQQEMAGMDSKTRAEFTEKASEAAARMAETRQAHQDMEADKAASRALMAQNQAAMRQEHQEALALRMQEHQDRVQERAEKAPTTKEMADGLYEYDPGMGMKGTRNATDPRYVKIADPKLSATERQANKAIVGSSGEAMRGLNVIGAMKSDQTAGPFAGLSDGTLLGSLAKTGTTALTPADMQIYHTAASGMGLEVARTMTLGGGRGANQSTINEMQQIIEVHPGETRATAMFKFANAADIIRTRLASTPRSGDPVVDKQRDEVEAQLRKIPTPQQILAATSDVKQRESMLAVQEKVQHTSNKIQSESQDGTGLPGTPDAGAGTNAPPLPAGWSVKVH